MELPYAGQRDAASQLGRLRGQCRWILDRLRRGPATNRELASYSLKYTGRISDLRAMGCAIDCDEDRATGVATYRLVSEPEHDPVAAGAHAGRRQEQDH
jgi:hypothetical protein